MNFGKNIIALLAFFVLGHSQLVQAAWDQYTYNDCKYVTVQNVKDYYQFTSMQKSGNSITLKNQSIKVELTLNSYNCFMNNIKFVLSKPITMVSGKALISQLDLVKLIDPVLRPSNIKNSRPFRTVIIDPGHGGKDPGAVNRLATEAYYNLRVAKKLEYLLTQRGYQVVMTRSTDKTVSLNDRVSLANKYPDAIFISIHFNAGGAGKAKGMETFILSPKGVAHPGRNVKASDHKMLQGNLQDSQNIALATAIHGSSMLRLRLDDRGIKRARYRVLCGIRHPAILIEGGFMSNPEEAKKIHTASHQDNLAKGIAEGIMKYQSAVSQ